MRLIVALLLLFTSLPAFVPNANAVQPAIAGQDHPLVRNIFIQGFVLEDDKGQFAKLFRPYRDKHLSTDDMDTILQQLRKIYEEAGYQGLVDIEYHVSKGRLIYTVSLIK